MTLRALFLAAIAWVVTYEPTQGRVYDVQIDSAFSPRAQMAIAAAVAAWRRAVPLTVPHTSVGAACDPATARHVGRLICVTLATPASLPENTVGWTTSRGPLGALVVLPESTDQADAAHELGHAMGLEHSKKTHTVMYAYKWCDKEAGIRCDAATPTQDDVRAWHAIRR